MRLLVSVSDAEEVSAALAGDADVVDAKDPRSGALGAVPLDVFRAIHAAVAGARPVTAAIGDASDEACVQRTAHAFAGAGARFVKVGFAAIESGPRVAALARAAVRGASAAARDAAVIVVAYADAERAASLSPTAMIDVAARAGARGVLLDTADKRGPGLRALVPRGALAAWVTHAHDRRLLVALAGKLSADDLAFVCDAGADIAGVRGAACDGGRTGRVSADRVRDLRIRLDDLSGLGVPRFESAAPLAMRRSDRPRHSPQ